MTALAVVIFESPMTAFAVMIFDCGIDCSGFFRATAAA
jgi:hypothetical protein